MYIKLIFERKPQLQKLMRLVWKKGTWNNLFSPSHFSLTKFMVQFQKWREKHMWKHASNYFSMQSLTLYVNQRLTGTSGLLLAPRCISVPELPTLVLAGSDLSPQASFHVVDVVPALLLPWGSQPELLQGCSSTLQHACSISRLGASPPKAGTCSRGNLLLPQHQDMAAAGRGEPCSLCPAPGPQVGNLAAKRVFLQLL